MHRLILVMEGRGVLAETQSHCCVGACVRYQTPFALLADLIFERLLSAAPLWHRDGAEEAS